MAGLVQHCEEEEERAERAKLSSGEKRWELLVNMRKLPLRITHSSLESRDQRDRQMNRGGDLFERQIGMQKTEFLINLSNLTHTIFILSREFWKSNHYITYFYYIV